MKSVTNALRALTLLNEYGALRVVDVAAHLGLAKSSAHRLLATLRSFDFVAQDENSKCYRLGSAFFDIALTQNPDHRLVAAARRELEKVAEITKETAHLIVLRGPDVVFLDGVEGDLPVRVATRTGDRLPAYTAAAGKLLLSERSTSEIYELFPHGLSPMTSSTIPNRHELIADISAIKEKGYAVNRDESIDGVSAVAVKVGNFRGGMAAAVTVSVPTLRFTEDRVERILSLLQSAAAKIAKNLIDSAVITEEYE